MIHGPQFKAPSDPEALVRQLDRLKIRPRSEATDKELEFKNRAGSYEIRLGYADQEEFVLKSPLRNGSSLSLQVDTYIELSNQLARITQQDFRSDKGVVEINKVIRADVGDNPVIASKLIAGRSFGEIFEDDEGWDQAGYSDLVYKYRDLILEFREFAKARCIEDLGIDITTFDNPHRPSQVWDSYIVPGYNLSDFPQTILTDVSPFLICVNPISFDRLRDTFKL